MTEKDDGKKDDRKGMYVSFAGVGFLILITGFITNQLSSYKSTVEREFEIDRRITDVERVVAEFVTEDTSNRLDAAERVANQIVDANIFNRLDITERVADNARQWTEDWEASGELPIDIEQNRKIRENRTELDIVHRGINTICYGLRDREPQPQTNGRWPPCDEISRVR